MERCITVDSRPLVTARIVVEMVQMQGVRVTAQRMTNSIFRRLGLRAV